MCCICGGTPPVVPHYVPFYSMFSAASGSCIGLPALSIILFSRKSKHDNGTTDARHGRQRKSPGRRSDTSVWAGTRIKAKHSSPHTLKSFRCGFLLDVETHQHCQGLGERQDHSVRLSCLLLTTILANVQV